MKSRRRRIKETQKNSIFIKYSSATQTLLRGTLLQCCPTFFEPRHILRVSHDPSATIKEQWCPIRMPQHTVWTTLHLCVAWNLQMCRDTPVTCGNTTLTCRDTHLACGDTSWLTLKVCRGSNKVHYHWFRVSRSEKFEKHWSIV
jgi:hypothetical protein